MVDFLEFEQAAIELQDLYDKNTRERNMPVWQFTQRVMGLLVDVGELVGLILESQGFYKTRPDIRQRLKHELGDCLHTLLMIANYLGIDLQKAYFDTIEEVKERLKQSEA